MLLGHEEGGSKIVEGGVGRAVDDGGLEAEGARGDETQLGNEVVDGRSRGAYDAVLAADQAKEGGQVQVAEAVDLA